MSENTLNVTNFQEDVLNETLPVLVDFWAPWCGPCRMIAPVVEEIASEYKDKVKVCKVNIDEAPDVATQYGIMSIPTLAIFKKGELVDKVVGAVAKTVISEKLDANI